MKIALLTGLLAMFVMPLAANAAVNLSVGPDVPGALVSNNVALNLIMNTDVGTATDNATFSVGCTGCTITNFVYNEAYGAGSGLVTWMTGKTVPVFATGGTQTNLNTTGSAGAAVGTGGAIIGDGSYVGSIGFQTLTAPGNGDGLDTLIGTVTVHVDAGGAVVSPFFRLGEGIFNLAPAVPTTFASATLGVPEPTTASLLALGLGGLALLGRRNRR